MIVVILSITNYNVHCVLVDNRSLVDILFYDAFSKMGFPSEWLWNLDFLIMGFLREVVPIKEVITLSVIVG